MCICPAGVPANFDNAEGTFEMISVLPDGDQILSYSVAPSAADKTPRSDTLDWDGDGSQPSNASCMLIVLPAKRGTFDPAKNLLDVSAYPKYMQNVVDAAFPPRPVMRSRSVSFGTPVAAGFTGEVTRTVVGKFEVFTCTSALDLSKLLPLVQDPKRRIPEDRGPRPGLCQLLDNGYGPKGFVFLMAFFDASDNSRSNFAVRFCPANPDIAVFPALDGHDPDEVPVPGQMVQRKHKLLISTPNMIGGNQVTYTDNHGDVPAWMPRRVRGFNITEYHQNGDFAIPIADVEHAGQVRVFTLLPPAHPRAAGFVQEKLTF